MKIEDKRTSLLRSAVLATILLALTSVAGATPFSSARVPAQAEGVAHLDMEKLRASGLWKTIVDQLPKEAKAGIKADVSKQILKALEDMGEDGMIAVAGSVMANTKSITVWGSGSDQSALLIELPLASSMMAIVDGTSKLQTSTKKGVKLFHIGDDAFLGVHGNTLVVSDDAEVVITSVRVLTGKSKSLSSRKLGKLNAASKKGILFVAGFGGKLLEDFKKSAASAALQADIRTIIFHIGEQKGDYFAEAEAELSSPGEATNLASVVTGLLGLVSLGNDDPDLAKLISGLTVKAKGAALLARLEVSKQVLNKLIADQTKP